MRPLPGAYLLLNPGGTVVQVNRGAEQLLRGRSEELVERPLADFVMETPAVVERQVVNWLRVGEFTPAGLILRDREAGEQTFSGARLDLEDGPHVLLRIEERVHAQFGLLTTKMLELAEENSRRQQAEQTLRLTKDRLKSIIDNSPSLIYLRDQNARLFMTNEPFRLAFGDERAPELPEEWLRADLAAIEAGEPGELTETFEIAGEQRTFFTVRFPLIDPMLQNETLCVIANEVTDLRRASEEREKLQLRIQHTQKLESLGVLAGGIAHDFNNLLVGVLANASLCISTLPDNSLALESARDIESAATQAADLCRQLLAYSGRGRFVVRTLEFSELVREMSRLLEISLSKKATIRTFFDEQDLPVEADAAQLRQVVMNLVTNASEALGDESGVITIRTGRLTGDATYFEDLQIGNDLGAGQYVFLEVSDTGCGMDKETLARLFDPFFTTKFTGRGLGLAAAQGIIKGHGGAIKVYSEPGRGTTFMVVLPRAGSDALSSPEVSGPGRRLRGSGTVLVADDEPAVRRASRLTLENAGYKVLEAKDGLECVEVFRQNPAIDVVLLDMTMPRMGGEDAFRELRRIRSNVAVLLSSGYNEQEATSMFVGKGLAGFIQKPYRAQELIQAVMALAEVVGS